MKSSFRFLAALVAVALVMALGATALLVAAPPALAAPAAVGGLGSEAWSYGMLAAADFHGARRARRRLRGREGRHGGHRRAGREARALRAAADLRRPRRGHRDLRPHRVDPDPQPARVMATPIFIGDEVTAAGYRLAGVRVRAPAPGDETARARRRPRRGAAGPHLRRVRGARRRRALRDAVGALAPVVVVVADAQGDVAPPDLAARLRGQLGLEA